MFLSGIFTKIINAAKTVKVALEHGIEMREAPTDPEEIEEEQDEDEIFVPEKNVFIRVKVGLGEVWIDGNQSDEELAITSKGLQEDQYEKENVDDRSLFDEYSDSDPIQDKTPESGWDHEYLPAGLSCNGKRPNMYKIKEWVLKYKLAGFNTEDYQAEYLKVTGSVTKTWDSKKRDQLADKIAFIIGRKIWYVGRRSNADNDKTWQERTSDKRPEQGTFSSNEHWTKEFPYTKSYRYKSWGKDEEDQLKTTGKLSW